MARIWSLAQEGIEDSLPLQRVQVVRITKVGRALADKVRQSRRCRSGVEDVRILRRERITWESLDRVGRRSGGNTETSVVRSSGLQKRLQFPPLGSWHGCRRLGALNRILIEVHQTEVVVWEVELLVSPLNACNVRTWRFKRLDKPVRKNRDQDACPLQGVKEARQGCTCQLQH